MAPLFVLEVPAAAAIPVRNLTNPHPVARIKALAELREHLDEALAEAVREARSMRPKAAKWEEIARAAGIPLSTAHGRWATSS